MPAPLKLHDTAKWHRDAAIVARMAEQSASTWQPQLSKLKKNSKKNRSIVLKLCSQFTFLAKHRISHTTTFEGQVKLQVANGDEILRVLAHRKYRRPRSRPHLIDHIFEARITLVLLFASLFY